MNLFTQNLDSRKMFSEILDEFNKSNSKVLLNNIIDSEKAMYVYSLTKNSKKSSVIVCSNNVIATKMLQDLKFFSDIEIVYFPTKELVYFDLEAESKEVQNDRMYALSKIKENTQKIVVTTVEAMLLAMPKENGMSSIVVKKGDSINLTNLVQGLIDLGYEGADSVEGKGQFALRGGILDVFALDSDMPCRIELFGDEVESIRYFDVLSQRSISNLDEIKISCISDIVLTDDKINLVIEKINGLLDSDISDELRQNLKKDVEIIENRMLDNLINKYFTLLVEKPVFLTDYLKDYNVFIDEPSNCRKKAEGTLYENKETLKVLNDRGYLYPDFANKYIEYDRLEKMLNSMNITYLQKQVLDNVFNSNLKEFDLNSKEIEFYRNSFETLLVDITNLKYKNIVLVFPNNARIEQVKNYLLDNKVKVEVLDNIWQDKTLEKGVVYITYGILSCGFNSNASDLVLICENVSGTNLKKRAKYSSFNGTKVDSFEDLKEGDYVVHENHGIGVYRGVITINIQEVVKDYIKIEYSNGGILYIPINQLDLVKKYVCDDDAKPKLNTLGTKEWEKTKRKVNEHVEEVAKDLMSLYAKREKNPGYAFSKDTPWQKEFEDSVSFELTDDQKTSIEEIKEDMESPKVMDRLLCGDVGYGKTEVALRAAFKAVMDKKQVAYLVPTTVLCLQQYNTFKNRMESFGIKVEMLCRFKTKKEQTQILKDLVDGKIDVVVGTHRILSSDVIYNDLGLLVIDEEHRFGVKAKESIKKLKETVDVLSMTATPIPRTLHMSMVGIRGMSTLNEPPIERLPVHTFVMEYDEAVIKEAIEKELLRNGQVFYLNNRVEGIEDLANKVKRLVPNARVAYAHGRMEPREIENIMLKFINHEFDVIVCTSILESGIDIPNANTLIVENADKLGLAQLYQIRGRVGRSSKMAFAYITYKKDKQITEVAQKRIKAIRDFTEFGSGFKIALRDLEIRGAGSLFGKAQHGHMVKVGYDLYLTLLARAIDKEKNGEKAASLNIEQEIKIDLDVSAYISNNYIKDPIQKIAMYQKISDIKDKDTMLDVVDELIDRYGDIPKETENLIKIVEIRNLARKIGIKKIGLVNDVLRLEPNNFKIYLTNYKRSDILIRVQLELEKLYKEREKLK